MPADGPRSNSAGQNVGRKTYSSSGSGSKNSGDGYMARAKRAAGQD